LKVASLLKTLIDKLKLQKLRLYYNIQFPVLLNHMKLAIMESINVVYMATEIIPADHHALNHLPDEIFAEENKAIIRQIGIKREQEPSAPFCDELHFANYE